MNSTPVKRARRNRATSAGDHGRTISAGRRLAPAGAWLRDAVQEVRRDIAEVKSGRKGFLKTYSVDELLKELHS